MLQCAPACRAMSRGRPTGNCIQPTHDISFRMLDQKPGNWNFVRFVKPLIHFDVVQLALERAALEHVQTKV
jgi:hypothetical protein